MLCLYQVTEFLKFKTPTDADNSWTSSTIPNALSRILVNIASHVKQNPVTSPKVKLPHLLLLMSFAVMSPNFKVGGVYCFWFVYPFVHHAFLVSKIS